MVITKEKKIGICSSYILKCLVCNYQKEIRSEDPCNNRNLNNEFVSGILKIKCSFQDANVLLSEMLLPLINNSIFVKAFDKVCFPLYKVDSKKTDQNASENRVKMRVKCAGKIVNIEPQLTAMQQCSSESDNSNLLEQVDSDSDCMIIEDQFENKEKNAVENQNGLKAIILDQTVETSDNNLLSDAGKEQVLNTATISQEINSDDGNLTNSITNKTPDKEKITENDEKSIFNPMLSQQNEARSCENRKIVNQGQVNLHENLMIKNNKGNNTLNLVRLVKPEFNSVGMRNKKSVTDFDDKCESESPLKKARTESYKESNDLADTKEIPTTAPSKEINVLQSKLQSNGLVTATSSITSGGHVTATSTNVENITAAPSITKGGGGNVTSVIPKMSKSNSNGSTALIASQMPPNLENETYQGKDIVCTVTNDNKEVKLKVTGNITDPCDEKLFDTTLSSNTHCKSPEASSQVKEVEDLEERETVPKDCTSPKAMLDCGQNSVHSFTDSVACTSSYSVEVSEEKSLQSKIFENDIDMKEFREEVSSSSTRDFPSSGKDICTVTKSINKEIEPKVTGQIADPCHEKSFDRTLSWNAHCKSSKALPLIKEVEGLAKREIVPKDCTNPITMLDCVQNSVCNLNDSVTCTSSYSVEVSEEKSLKSESFESDIDMEELQEEVSSSTVRESPSSGKLKHPPETSSQVKEVEERGTVPKDCTSPKTMLDCVQNSVCNFNDSTACTSSYSVEVSEEKSLKSESIESDIDMEEFPEEVSSSTMRESPSSGELKHPPKAKALPQVKEVEKRETAPTSSKAILDCVQNSSGSFSDSVEVSEEKSLKSRSIESDIDMEEVNSSTTRELSSSDVSGTACMSEVPSAVRKPENLSVPTSIQQPEIDYIVID